MDRKSYFGVGCFHFGVSVTVPTRFDVKQYVGQIESFLDFTETVEKHSVEAAEEETIELTEQPHTMESGGFFPGQHLHKVEFIVRIARRVQTDIMRSIMGTDYSYADDMTEIFKVTTEYYYHGPVTVIECLDTGSRSIEPADAVVLVREYIGEKVNEYGSSLRFETTGPSPFPGHFSVTEDESLRSYKVEHDQSHGYDRVAFRVSPELYGDRTTWVLDLMGHHLSYFYSLSRIRSQRMRAWSGIEQAWNDLKGIIGASIGSKVRIHFGRRARTERLISDIFDFRSEEVFERQQAVSQRKSLARSGNYPDFLVQSVEEAFEETFQAYPTTEVLGLAGFLESKNAKRRDRSAYFFAAVSGGVVGSIITLLARYV